MDLTKILMQSLGNGGLEQLAGQVGLNSNQTRSAVGALVPTLLSAMASNTSTQAGASGLLSALDRDHDGSIMDDLAGFLGNTESANGNGIIKHVLGNERSTVEEGLASKLGINAGSIAKLLPIIAPMVLAYLGRQKRAAPAAASAGFDTNSIAGLLGNLAGNSAQSNGFDISDIMNIVGGLSGGNKANSSGMLEGLLKNVLKG